VIAWLQAVRWKNMMNYLKALCSFAFLIVLAANIWSMSYWSEARGVYDDVCYLRQAHLFQKFGLGGLDTDIARDDDHYLASKLKQIDYPGWNDPATAPCHVLMPATQKRVMQYPPGTGFVLALFPQGFQVIPLFVLASVVTFGFMLLAVAYASTPYSLMLVAAFGDAAIYLMINPAKASYSMAPTLVVCALAGFLTARWFKNAPQTNRVWLTLSIGFLLGLAVNFRLSNLFLSAGYFAFFLVSVLVSRKIETVVQGALFGVAFLAGMVPTLLANAINAGSAFATTYGSGDVVPPDFGFGIAWRYVADVQFVLLAIAGGWALLILCLNRGDGARQMALVTAGNLAVNSAFFMSHPVFAPYYIIPIAMLSLWSLLFVTLTRSAEAVEDDFPGQASKSRS
jgi:hypothetical protein